MKVLLPVCDAARVRVRVVGRHFHSTDLEALRIGDRVFRALSSAARERFQRGDWAAVGAATRERIQSYDLRVREAVADLTQRFPACTDESLWPALTQASITLLEEAQFWRLAARR